MIPQRCNRVENKTAAVSSSCDAAFSEKDRLYKKILYKKTELYFMFIFAERVKKRSDIFHKKPA